MLLHEQQHLQLKLRDPEFVAGGWVGKGVIRSRPFDAVVVGLSNANWSRAIPNGPIWESVLKLGNQVMLGKSASIQPNLQYVFNPMGQGKVDDALVLGLQMNITF